MSSGKEWLDFQRTTETVRVKVGVKVLYYHGGPKFTHHHHHWHYLVPQKVVAGGGDGSDGRKVVGLS